MPHPPSTSALATHSGLTHSSPNDDRVALNVDSILRRLNSASTEFNTSIRFTTSTQSICIDSIHRANSIHCIDSIHRANSIHCIDSIHCVDSIRCIDSIVSCSDGSAQSRDCDTFLHEGSSHGLRYMGLYGLDRVPVYCTFVRDFAKTPARHLFLFDQQRTYAHAHSMKRKTVSSRGCGLHIEIADDVMSPSCEMFDAK